MLMQKPSRRGAPIGDPDNNSSCNKVTVELLKGRVVSQTQTSKERGFDASNTSPYQRLITHACSLEFQASAPKEMAALGFRCLRLLNARLRVGCRQILTLVPAYSGLVLWRPICRLRRPTTFVTSTGIIGSGLIVYCSAKSNVILIKVLFRYCSCLLFCLP